MNIEKIENILKLDVINLGNLTNELSVFKLVDMYYKDSFVENHKELAERYIHELIEILKTC